MLVISDCLAHDLGPFVNSAHQGERHGFRATRLRSHFGVFETGVDMSVYEFGSSPPSTIPAVTDWGLAALAMVMLAFGAAIVRRRTAVA